MSETNVQKKLSKLIKVELSDILSRDLQYIKGVFLTVTLVKVPRDLGLAKIYISTLPDTQLETMVETLNEHDWEIRKALAAKIRNKVRKIPELRFYADDSSQYADNIDKLLKDL